MIAFTICSNNYLMKALALKSSILSFGKFSIYLVLADEMSDEIDYDALGFQKVITIDQLNITNLDWQLNHYSIVEFNTSLKGEAFKYLFETIQTEVIYYFDPDIKVFQPLDSFSPFFEGTSILLTPHILSPIPHDELFPSENLFLNHGIYNLGFLGIRRTETSLYFLTWWCERLANKSIIDLKEGYFTDQIWFNLVPLFFEDVTILKHPGFNVAYWNLHERIISIDDVTFKVNKEEKLYFYHFSSFDETLQRLIPSEKPRFNFQNRSGLLALYQGYKLDLEKEKKLPDIKYFNGKYPLPTQYDSLIKRVTKKIKATIISKLK